MNFIDNCSINIDNAMNLIKSYMEMYNIWSVIGTIWYHKH